MSNNNSNNNTHTNSNNGHNQDRVHYPINYNVNYENKKWDSCNYRQENAKYGFNVMPDGYVSAGGRAQTVSGGISKFHDNDILKNPLDLINKK